MSKAKKGKNENLTYQTEPTAFFKPAVSPQIFSIFVASTQCDPETCWGQSEPRNLH